METLPLVVLATVAAVAATLWWARRRPESEATIGRGAPSRRDPAAPPGATAEISYTDADGRRTRRVITLLEVTEREPGGAAYMLRAWCHLRRDPRHFLVPRIGWLADGETGELYTQADHIAVWADLALGKRPYSVIPEVRPGRRVSTHRPTQPIAAVLAWERTPGDLETFDIAIDEVEMAGGVPFAFSGRATRRASATDRRWTGRRRFKLRGWDTPEAPILWLAEEGNETPLAAPHRWLAEKTRR